jgi:O-antigen/teichoic acid export membrane protein
MIQGALGQAEVARYQVAYNIGSLPMLALGALTTVWLPRFFAVSDEHQRGAVLVASRAALQRLLAPVLVGMALASPIVLQIWAPPAFRPIDLMLVTAIIVVSAVPFTAVQSATRDLLTQGRTRAVAASTLVAAGANIGLNLVLIPAWGIDGAALATLLAYAAQHGLLLAATGRRSGPGSPRKPMIELAAASVTAFAVLLLPTGSGGLVLRAVVAVICLAWFGWLVRSLARQAGTAGSRASAEKAGAGPLDS